MPETLTTGIRWSEAAFRPLWRQELFRSNAIVQARALGPMLWRASYRTFPDRLHVAEAFEATMQALRGSIDTFYGHTARRCRPLHFSGGGLPNLVVHSIRSDRRAIRINNLPAGLDLARGDFLSITNDQGGRELLRLTTAGSVSSTGLSAWVDVVPNIRVSVKVGQEVRMVNPVAELRLDPDTLDLVEKAPGAWCVVFSATQVVR